jgi:hypothetical protein
LRTLKVPSVFLASLQLASSQVELDLRTALWRRGVVVRRLRLGTEDRGFESPPGFTIGVGKYYTHCNADVCDCMCNVSVSLY